MMRTHVIIGRVRAEGKGWCLVFQSALKLSSEADASFYDTETFEMHVGGYFFSNSWGKANTEE